MSLIVIVSPSFGLFEKVSSVLPGPVAPPPLPAPPPPVIAPAFVSASAATLPVTISAVAVAAGISLNLSTFACVELNVTSALVNVSVSPAISLLPSKSPDSRVVLVPAVPIDIL